MADVRREHLQASVPEHLAGERLDRVLAELFPDFSRSRLQQWVKEGRCDLDGQAARNKDKVAVGQEIRLDAEFADQVAPHAQDIPLAVVYEDDALIVINKPPGLVVHPAAGNPDGTLQNAL